MVEPLDKVSICQLVGRAQRSDQVGIGAPGVWTALFGWNSVSAVCSPLQVQPSRLPAVCTAILTVCNVLGLIVTIPTSRPFSTTGTARTPRGIM